MTMAYLDEPTPVPAALSIEETFFDFNAASDGSSDERVREGPVSPGLDVTPMADLFPDVRVKEDSMNMKQEKVDDYCPIMKEVRAPISEAHKAWNGIRSNADAARRFSHKGPAMVPTTDRQDPRRRFCCSICKQKFQTRGRLTQHHGKYHPDLQSANSALRCGECGKWCKNYGGLSRHIAKHEREDELEEGVDERPYYVCFECGKTCTSQSGLTQHARVHDQEEEFTTLENIEGHDGRFETVPFAQAQSSQRPWEL